MGTKSVLLCMTMLSFVINFNRENFSNGMYAARNNNWEKASRLLNKSILEESLAITEYVEAYWNIHIAESNLRNVDADMEALSGFVSWGFKFRSAKLNKSYGGWAKDFKLSKRMNMAFSLLQAHWASKNKHSCRTPEFSCYIDHRRAIHLFKKHIPFCKGSSVKTELTNVKYPVRIVSVECSNGTTEKYYFHTKP